MSQSICFQSVEFDVIQRNQQPWVRGIQIGYALKYQNPAQAIAKLYDSHADEFTPAMTAVITLPTEGGPQETRIFSLRGCHLLAMFARTPVAKQFRRWVLDVIEQYGDRVPVEPAALPDESPAFPGSVSVTPSTVEDRKPLRSLVNAWAQVSAQPFNVCWTQLKAAFRLSDIRDLPQEWIPDALAWIQTKIDGITISRKSPEIPVVPSARFFHADRAKSLHELEQRFIAFEGETRSRFAEIEREYRRINQSSFSDMLSLIPSMDQGARDRLASVFMAQSYDAYDWIDEGLSRMRLAIVSARAANRTLAR